MNNISITEGEIKSIFQRKYNFEIVQPILEKLFPQVQILSRPLELDADEGKARSIVQLGRVELFDGRGIALFEVEVADGIVINRNRKELRDIAARYIDQSIIHGALVFYYSQNQADYRLSLIAKTTEFSDEGALIKTETAPKRFTYVLGPNEPCTTAAKQFLALIAKSSALTLTDIVEAFSVERLNKEFFKRYKEHYERFWRYIAERDDYAQVLLDPDKSKNIVQRQKPIRDFAKKLLGRLVFLQFLQKKGWMGVPSHRDDWEEGDKRFVRHLFDSTPDREKFHSEILTKLFFDTLNRQRPNDIFFITNNKVPFLNGGLFDRDSNPSIATKTERFDFPAAYFVDLLDTFDQFNFTIDENSVDEQEVGIDPEMLGHIFENLLEENREKGTFYTPKEVVYFMCHEALVQYLKPHFPAEADIDTFIRRKEVSAYLGQRAQATRLNKLLDDVKICDPAIGSGAFPIGMLQEVFLAKRHIFPYLNGGSFDETEVKLGILEHSIYGVDLDSGAVDIARLRFWLALVVDEKKPRQLPNLDYKIMQGNSLFESFEGIDLSNVHQANTVKVVEPNRDLFGNIIDPQMNISYGRISDIDLPELIERYFAANDQQQKQQLRNEINDHIHDHIEYNLELRENNLTRQLNEAANVNTTMLRASDQKRLEKLQTDLNNISQIRQRLQELQQTTERPYFLWHLYFQDVLNEPRKGFDIVIGNPPYFSVSKQPELKTLAKKYTTFESTGDIYALFYERGYEILRPGGVLVYITGSSWLRSNYGKSLRKFFADHTDSLKLVDLSDCQIFESATVLTTIMAFRKAKNRKQLEALRLTRRTQQAIKVLDAYFKTHHIVLSDQPETAWVVLTRERYELKKQIEAQGKKIKEWGLTINYGIKTGLNQAFEIFDSEREALTQADPNSEHIVKRWLRGRHIHKYSFDRKGNWLIFTRKGIDIDRYPIVKAHLRQYYEDLKPKNNGEERGRKPGPYAWYEIQDNIAYYRDFEKPKLIYPEITKDLVFCYDDEGFYTNNKCFIATGEHLKYLLAFFNSKLFRYAFEEDFPELQGNSRELRKVILEEIPVKVPTEDEEQRIEILADYLLYLYDERHNPINPYVENYQVALLFEDIINHLICELYFFENMLEKEITIGSLLSLQPVAGLAPTEQATVINEAYNRLQLPGNPVRQALAEAPLELPETIGRILSNIV